MSGYLNILLVLYFFLRRILYIEMACNGMFGGGSGLIDPPSDDKTYTLSTAEIRVFNRKAYELLMDVETLYDMAKVM